MTVIGTSLVVSVIGLTFVYDTAAFLSGSVWGGQFFERPLAPTMATNSPRCSGPLMLAGSKPLVRSLAPAIARNREMVTSTLPIAAALLTLLCAAVLSLGTGRAGAAIPPAAGSWERRWPRWCCWPRARADGRC